MSNRDPSFRAAVKAQEARQRQKWDLEEEARRVERLRQQTNADEAWRRPRGMNSYEGTNGFAVAALVLGLLWFGGTGSVLALVFGIHAHNEIASTSNRQAGWSMASWGIALGVLGIIGAIILWASVGVAIAHAHDQLNQFNQQLNNSPFDTSCIAQGTC